MNERGPYAVGKVAPQPFPEGATASERISLGDSLAKCHEQFETLIKAVASLEQKLDPICTPPAPQVAEDTAKRAQSGPVLVESAEGLAYKLRALRRHVEVIESRVCV